jgi:hypothetical protein
MCRFHSLNKACKKDGFPLERVDKIVDDAANSEMLSLLDMFSGYHQIRVRKEDEEKTSFITPFGTYCFMRMPEGCWGSGPAHVRVSGPLCGLEGFLVNTTSTRGSEENNH